MTTTELRATEGATATPTTIDPAKLDDFVGRFVGELGVVFHAATVVIGYRLGLYAAMADSTPVTSAELAQRCGVDERYLREWLSAQAAAAYVVYDPAAGTFTLPPEQAATLVEGSCPVFIPGALMLAGSTFKDEPALADAFRAGEGYGWHQHHQDLFTGTEKFFRPSYASNLVESWLPALEGVVAKLTAGARVADVGCGLGASTILMAQAFPASRFAGSDYHERSIELARHAADRAGVADRVSFEVAAAQVYGGENYDLVTCFDCLHDMGDPVGAAARVRASLAPDGTWLIVEPMAAETLEGNLNPIGRIFYSASTLICTPAARAQEVGLALGAQASEAQIADVVHAGGFSRFRLAAQTPFNRVFEARP
jgi:2-polyprenyl-3-methyl-5-hydroxy-6-metoxy-1,4-benzoquinol methylase